MTKIHSVADLYEDPQDHSFTWKVLPFIYGRGGQARQPMVLDFFGYLIAENDHGEVRVPRPRYELLDGASILDPVEHSLFGIPSLPNAIEIINSWGLAEEMRRRIQLLREGRLHDFDNR